MRVLEGLLTCKCHTSAFTTRYDGNGFSKLLPESSAEYDSMIAEMKVGVHSGGVCSFHGPTYFTTPSRTMTSTTSIPD